MTRCVKCQGTKLIPFKGRKDAWVDCPDCQVEPPERYHHYQASDFDFPVSWDFYRLYSNEYGKGDPGSLEPSMQKTSSAPETISAPATGDLLELRCLILDVEDKIDRHTKPQKQDKKWA